MTQHLQKIVMSFFVSAFLIIAFSIDSQAQQLNTVWDRTTVTDNLPDWFTPGYVRGMTHGTMDGNERLYAVNRSTVELVVLDPADGSRINLDTPFDLSGLSGGTYAMNTTDISDDGVLFVGNLTTDAESSPFRLYWWDSEGGTYTDSLTFSATGRIGDRFTVMGSLSDNTIEIWMPAAGSDPGVIYVATTEDQGANWDIETITVSGDVTAIGSGVTAKPFELGRTSDFYVAGNALTPTRYDANGAYVTDSQISSTSRNGFDLFSANGSDYLSVYTYRPDGVSSGNKTGQVYVYDITDPTATTIVAESPLMGPDADSFSSIYGEARVRVNEDGTYNVFALEGVNGIASFTNAEPAYYDDPANLFFSEYIEGSSNNKALEITNNTDSTVYLANYQIAQSNNGDDWEYYFSFAEDASIAAGETYVIITDQVDAGLFAAENADEVLGYPSPIHFNGNDARAIIHIDAASGDTTFTDVFGDPNSDADWDVAGVYQASTGYTLQRKPSVTEGNITVLGSFGTNYDDSEWIVKSENVFNNLGSATESIEALSGDYFVPQRPSDAEGFISLHQAFHYVNSEGLSANANLMITADLDESFDSLIINRGDLTESTALTIKPDMGVSPTIEVQGGPGSDGIWINGTDYVTIDGSNAPGGDTRDLTITSSDSTLSALIYTYAASNTTIANSILTYTGGDVSTSAIVTNESGPSATVGLSVINNQIGSVDGDFQNGVGLWGTSSLPAEQSTVSGNRIHATYRGVTTWWSNDNTITNNTISIDSPRADRSRYTAIYLALNGGKTTVTGNEIVGLKVNRTTSAGYAAGILFNASLDTVQIANNMIAIDNFENIGDAVGNNVYGIAFDNAAGNSINSIYHNTIRIGSSSETGVHAAFGSEGEVSTAQIWDLKNNIFSVEQDAGNANTIFWPITSTDNLDSDHNNLFVSGSSASVGYFNDAATASFSDWQSASGIDLNSTNVEVEFASETDLRLAGASVGDDNLAGTPLASVVTDIDGNARSATAPYKGAFEADVALDSPNTGIMIGAFTLLAPANDTDLNLTGDESTEVVISWEKPTAPDSVTYTWHADAVGGDFSDPLVSIAADNDGADTTLTLTYKAIDDVVAGLGVTEGDNIDLIWTVTAQAGDSVRFAEATFDLNIARNLSVSNEIEDQPTEFKLSQNYPNPFNPTSNIQFSIPKTSDVKLEVFNINGQLVRTLVNERMGVGEHTVQFNASDLASGIYIYRIIAGSFVQTKKMTLIK